MSRSATPTAQPESGFSLSAVVLLGILGAIEVADPLISSLALVKASSELNFTASIQSLAAGIATLALAATAIPGGMLADRFGRRRVLMIAVLVAAVGEVATALSVDSLMYLGGRVVAGVALGVVFGSSYGMLRNVSSSKSLGPAMGTFSVLNGIVPVFALVLGGILISVNWRLAYLFLPAICVVVIFFIPLLLPKVDKLPSRGRTDYLGMILVGLGIVGVLMGISGVSHGLASPLFWGPIVGAIVCFILFGVRESHAANPAFPIRLLKHPAFLGAVIMGIFLNLASASMTQQLPNIWQYVTHLRPALIGAASLPMSATGIIGSVVAGYLMGKGVKIRALAYTGYFFMAVGFATYFFVPEAATYAWFLPGMLLAAFGWMMNATSQGNLFIQLAPAAYYGPVTSSKMAVGQMGYAIGLTGSTVLVSTLTLQGVSDATKGAVSGDSNWDAVTDYMTHPTTTPKNPALAAVDVKTIEQIYTHAFNVTFLVMAIVLLAMGTLMYILLRRKNADIPTNVYLGLTTTESSGAPTSSAK